MVKVWVYSRCFEAGIFIPGLPGWTGIEILDVLFQGWYWLFYDVLKENGNSLLISDLDFDLRFHVDLSLGGQKFKITITQSWLKLGP